MKKESENLYFIFAIISLIIIVVLPLISSEIYTSPGDGSTTNDTYILNNSNTPQGSSTKIMVGKITNGDESRGLLFFNISSIPSTDTILDAKIQLYVNSSTGKSINRTIKIYRITGSFNESQATWYNKTSEQTWSSEGGDYDSLELNSTKVLNQSGLYYNFTIPGYIIKGWLNGTYNNYGLMIISNDSLTGNWTDFASSNNPDANQRPKIIINHVTNAPPTITGNWTDSSMISPINVGNNVTFSVNWTDPENNGAYLYICNSSNINYSGCTGKTYCSSSLLSPGVSNCSYTALDTDNKTVSFYFALCDIGSQNCSAIGQNYFYVNHAPRITLVHPNGGETLNQSLGNYTIQFNISEADNDYSMTADIYYGTYQNSTQNLIASGILVSSVCSSATGGNCSYSWNTTGLWGTNFYLTIIARDVFLFSSNASSNSSFTIRSLNDNFPPEIISQEMDSSDIYSGKNVQFLANITDQSSFTAWVSIRTPDSQTITINMTNSTSGIYYANWTAIQTGNYSFKVYAQDIIPNLNDSMPWQNFTIRKPNASPQNEKYPSSTLPNHLIIVSGELNATDSLKSVNASLNSPSGFKFLNDYPNITSIGNFTGNQSKEAVWIVSAPHNEGEYTFNITYTDQYGNSWNSTNFNITVTSNIGAGYLVSVSGYPEVQATENYFAESYFTYNGIYADPDSITINIKDAAGNNILASSMAKKQTGIYNYSYAVGSAPMAGQWATAINATKNSISYYASHFWKVVSALFDVRDINIINTAQNNLSISVIVENKGNSPTDIKLTWNLTTGANQVLSTGYETFAVGATPIIKYYYFTTNYTGAARIAFLGEYSSKERAGASKEFAITEGAFFCGDGSCSNGETCSSCQQDCGACSSQPSGGGSSGGGITTNLGTDKINHTSLILSFDKTVYVSRNIEKIISLDLENTGDIVLTGISLSLDLNNSYYTILNNNLTKLKHGEKYQYKIKILISDFIDDKEFNFTIKANEISKTDSSKIVMLNARDYFISEIKRLRDKANILRINLVDKASLDKLRGCEEIIDALQSDVDNSDYISAQNNIKNADDCLDNVKNIIANEINFPKITNYIYIISVILFLVVMLIVILGGYMFYRKLKLMEYFREKTPAKAEPIKKEYLDQKIREIEEKLKD